MFQNLGEKGAQNKITFQPNSMPKYVQKELYWRLKAMQNWAKVGAQLCLILGPNQARFRSGLAITQVPINGLSVGSKCPITAICTNSKGGRNLDLIVLLKIGLCILKWVGFIRERVHMGGRHILDKGPDVGF